MRPLYAVAATLIAAAGASYLQCAEEPALPIAAPVERSLQYRSLAKQVYESRLLADMEDPAGWTTNGPAKLSFSADRSMDGRKSLRFSARTDDYARRNGRIDFGSGGSASVVLRFDKPQDWSRFNRLSFHVYVHPSGMRSQVILTTFQCEGLTQTFTSPEAVMFYQNLKPGQWNHLVWEIPNLKRDRVTSLRIGQELFGHDREVDGTVTYDIDRIELQRVDAEPYEGWMVAPGRLAYNHVGYRAEEPKIAIGSNLSAAVFQVLDVTTGRVVLKKPVRKIETPVGVFDEMDFSELRATGTYMLRAGNSGEKPFRVADNIWTGTIWKAISFFFSERCGFDVGVHRVCHRDVQGVYEDVTKVINGGWHDAADFSQGFDRTGVSIYAMLDVARQLAARGIESGLERRVLDEAEWGLDWLLKNRFRGGYKVAWYTVRMYTDGVVGNDDDVVTAARNTPWLNFHASAVEALAYEVLKRRNPALAARALEAAKEDWDEAVRLEPQWSQTDVHSTASWGALASVHLFRTTGEQRYRDRGVQYGRMLLECQQREFPRGVPLTGFFYTHPDKKRLYQSNHLAYEEPPLLALAALAGAFPEHLDFMEWYGAITLYSEYYLKRAAKYAAPYEMLPAGVYRRGDIESTADPSAREQMLRQVSDGVRLTEEYYLRRFPVWTSFRFHGNLGVQMSMTRALSACVLVRGDLPGQWLLTKQFQWVFGGNPFCQSMMYGEGYDYPSLHAIRQADFVGALPVGMDSLNKDQPYWPASNYATHKEIWVSPTSRWLWNAAYVGVPAIVSGKINGARVHSISFSGPVANRTVVVGENGLFQTQVPAGKYIISTAGAKWDLTAISGGEYSLNLDPRAPVTITARAITREDGGIRVLASAEGKGLHRIALRCFNVEPGVPDREVQLRPGAGAQLEWDLKVKSTSVPWVILVVPDGDLQRKRELTGTLIEQRPQSRSTDAVAKLWP